MLSGKTALVTGASSGIGRATAETLGRNGADVLLNFYAPGDDRDEHRRGAREALDRIEESGGTGRIVETDVAGPDAATALVEECRTALGPVDVLVNNAGVFSRARLADLSRAELERTLAVNAIGPAMLTKAVAPAMAERGGGSVVNVSSVWAIRGSAGTASYTASKGALAALTRGLCQEFGGDGVRVNAVLPGVIATRMNAEQRGDDDYVRRVEASVPDGRIGDPGEVAEVVAFLAGPKASYVNGVCVSVDGGLATNAL